MQRTLFGTLWTRTSLSRGMSGGGGGGIHTNGAGEVPKTEANSGHHGEPKQTNRTGPKGDGDQPHPREHVNQIEEMDLGGEASPEKKPTRSTGIKSEHEGDSPAHSNK